MEQHVESDNQWNRKLHNNCDDNSFCYWNKFIQKNNAVEIFKFFPKLNNYN